MTARPEILHHLGVVCSLGCLLIASSACRSSEPATQGEGTNADEGAHTDTTEGSTAAPTTTPSTTAASTTAATGGMNTGAHETETETGIDHDSDPLEGMSEVVEVATGFQFTEGPVWLPQEGALLFTDIPADTIHRLDPPSTISVFRGPTQPPANANGLNLDPDGRLIACEHSTARVVRFTGAGTELEIIAASFDGGTFNSPNDLVARSDGTIYFTDPTYGGTGTVGFRGVFRIAPAGNVESVASYADTQPNGIGLSPDESTLYVVDTVAAVVRSFPVATDGTIGEGQVLAQTGGGGDGMAIDVNGNLYVTANAGVLVLRPDGTSWGTITFPQEPANCTFGGSDRRTLYVTARTALYQVELGIPGQPPAGL